MKLKLTPYNAAAALLWIVCLGVIGAGVLFSGGLQGVAIEQARRDLNESQEKLAFAQSAGKDETKQRTQERLARTRDSLNTFSCPAAAESSLIFQIGQLAHTLELKKFTSRFPDNVPEQTIEKSDRIAEGWLTVEFIADYLKAAAFVNSLERHEPLLFIESIHLRPSEEGVDEASVRLTLSYLIRKSGPAKTVAQGPAAN